MYDLVMKRILLVAMILVGCGGDPELEPLDEKLMQEAALKWSQQIGLDFDPDHIFCSTEWGTCVSVKWGTIWDLKCNNRQCKSHRS